MQIVNEKLRARMLDIGLLLMRLGFCGILIAGHGWGKLWNFRGTVSGFPDPIGLGSFWSGTLVIFAEVFCALGLLVGVASRLAAIPLIISFSVAVFFQHARDPFKVKELAVLYLVAFLVLLLTGPGRYSADSLILGKKGGK